MKVIDKPLVDLVEKFAQFIQRMTGITPIKIALVGEMVFGTSLMSVWILPEYPMLLKIMVTVAFTCILIYTFFAFPEFEQEIKNDVANKRSNQFKINPVHIYWRLGSLVCFVFSVFSVVFRTALLDLYIALVLSAGSLVASYFLACDPLSPSESKFKKFLSSHRIFWKRAKN